MARNILETIVRTKREELAEARATVSETELRARAADAGPTRDFYRAIASPPGHPVGRQGAIASPPGHPVGRQGAIASPPTRTVNLIAEIKKASPSAGVIRADFDVPWIASRYAAAGASALSILTDAHYFQGSLDYIAAARTACPLPILRKDFLIDGYQVYQARAAGADAILLIAAILDDETMAALLTLSAELNLAALVEVHDSLELARVQNLNAFQNHGRALLGVNNRNLKTFVTDCKLSVDLAAEVRNHAIFVSESGIHTRQHVEMLAAAGVRGILVGESLMRHADPADGVADLLG